MAFIPVPNGMSLCFDMVTDGQNWQFCLTARKVAGAPTAADLTAVAGLMGSWWTNTMKPLLTAQAVLRQVRVTDLTVQGGPQEIVTKNEAGTGAGSSAPLGTPIVVSLRTAKRGRSYRGRSYISGFSNGTFTDSVNVTSTMANNLASALATFVTTLIAQGFPAVIASRQHNGAVTNPAQTNDITALIADTHVDSQRRRLFGRGT